MSNKITVDKTLDSLQELHPMNDTVSDLDKNKLIVEIYKARLIAEALGEVASAIDRLSIEIGDRG